MLSEQDRQAVWAAWMRGTYGPVAVTKPQLRAAVDAADGWVESNLTAFTGQIPASLRSGTAPLVLLANSAGIARGQGPADVSAGVADRSQAGDLLTAYTAASAWLTAEATGYLTAIATAGAGSLTTAQSFAVLESVCPKRAEVL